MNTHSVRKMVELSVCVLVLSIIFGVAGCSKKPLRTGSPDALVGGSSTGSGSDHMASGSSPAQMMSADGTRALGYTEALGYGDPGSGHVGVDGQIHETEFEIMERDGGGATGGLGGTSLAIESGRLVPGGHGAADERIFIHSADAAGGVQGSTPGMISVPGFEENGMQASSPHGAQGRATNFLVGDAERGNITSSSLGSQIAGSGLPLEASGLSSREGETIVITPHSPSTGGDAGVGSDGSTGLRSLGGTRGSKGSKSFGSGISGSEPEHVSESLIVAQAQPNVLVRMSDEVANAEVPAIASAATETFFVQAPFEDVYFDYDRWAIPKPMQDRLSDHAQWLKAHPNAEVVIEGHCDVRGSREYNMVLGEKRARSVKSFLLDLGVTEDQVSLISFGKERLTCLDTDASCHQKNRRAHLGLR